MMGLSALDWLIVLVVFVSTVQAITEGFFHEFFSLAGVVVGYLIAAWEYPRAASWYLRFVNSQWTADIAGFFTIFFIVVLLAGLLGRVARWAVKGIGLRWFDRILGALFGFVRGVAMSAVIALALAAFAPQWGLQRSRIAPTLLVTSRGMIWAAPAELRQRFWQVGAAAHRASTCPAGATQRQQRPIGFAISDMRERGVVKDQLEALIVQMFRSGITYSEAVCEFKKKFILTVLQDSDGNQCKAARQLGMHRNTLSRTIADLKLDAKALRNGTRRPPRSVRTLPPDKKAAR